MVETKIIPWPERQEASAVSLRGRLEAVLAIFAEIHREELLAAFPTCELACEQHQRGLDLLAAAERGIMDIWGTAET